MITLKIKKVLDKNFLWTYNITNKIINAMKEKKIFNES